LAPEPSFFFLCQLVTFIYCAMGIRFFKKTSPETQPVFGNNTKADFKSLDGLIAYYATDQPYPQQELERFMTEGRYGITEITWEEFDAEYVQKKRDPNFQPLKTPWREEIGSGGKAVNRTILAQVGAEKVSQAVGLASPNAPKDTLSTVPPVAPNKPEEHKPNIGRRKSAPSPKPPT
jgi:hypothetical protein